MRDDAAPATKGDLWALEERMDARFWEMKERFEKIDERFGRMHEDIGRVLAPDHAVGGLQPCEPLRY